ncbi:MAG TPA: 23S rRNA (guanosine(2251)-2'-O)-methyltransferase RlmB [Pyrinomonadaceae bacterium]|nr:23S rRNA (guanosine(2251)-2'-O)-methyltransferase RlmB [Pyrinomonadaceae bacterium]
MKNKRPGRSNASFHKTPTGKSDAEIRERSTDQIYGLNPVLEALRAGRRPIEQITVAEGAHPERLRELLALAKAAKVPVHRVPSISFDRAWKDAAHQGVAARIAAARYHDADELLEEVDSGSEAPLVLGLDGIEDPRNLGAILRTAECTGVNAVFVPSRRAVGLTETVGKAAAGALEYVPVARVTNLARLIEQLKERNIWVIGASGDAPSLYTEWDWKLPSALFLGSEGHGLHRLVRERCDSLVRIPVVGKLESLNVSVAAGVLLYEALRQRSAAKELDNSRSQGGLNVLS